MRRAIAVDAVELAAARETASLSRHLRSEALPAFASAALEDRPAAARAHPCPESVRLGPLPLLRLIGPLHRPSQYTDAPMRAVKGGTNLSCGICGWGRFAGADRRYGRSLGARRRCDTRPRQALARRSAASPQIGSCVDIPPLV